MRRYLFAAMLLLCSNICFSQKTFLPGYVIRSNNDSLPGLIEYKEWDVNPTFIDFKQRGSDIIVRLQISQLQRFEVFGKDVYEKHTVQKDDLPVNVAGLLFLGEEKTVQETALLRILVKGNYSLFELIDHKPHFYLQQGSQEPQELLYKILMNKAGGSTVSKEGSGSYTTYPIYIQQLKAVATGKELLSKISKADYRETDLAAIVMKLNGNSLSKGQMQLEKKGVQFFAGGGIALNSFATTLSKPTFFYGNQHITLGSMQWKTKIGYQLRAGVDLVPGRALGRIFFRTELKYSHFETEGRYTGKDFYGDDREDVSEILMKSISPSIAVLGNFVNTENIKAFIGLGIMLNFSSYPKNKIVTKQKTYDDFLALQSTWSQYDVRLGILKEQYEVFITSKLTDEFNRTVGIGASTNNNTINFQYHFN